MFEVFFLGTGAAIPSKDRGHTTIAVRRNGEITLLDCGEGAQREMIKNGLSIMKVRRILITHLHADHAAGLFSLPQSLYLLNRREPLDIYGPKGIKSMGTAFEKFFFFEPDYAIRYHELPEEEALVYSDSEIEIRSVGVEHSLPTVAYSIREKDRLHLDAKKANGLGVKPGPLRKNLTDGKDIVVNGKKVRSKDVTKLEKGLKISYSGDTAPCQSFKKLARDSDLLIHEATFRAEKEAESKEYGHSTSVGAAKVAKETNSKKLALVHISPRYEEPKELEKEAKAVFRNTVASKDGMKLVLK
ncbi:MAG: ribonuclease Z [archaeon]